MDFSETKDINTHNFAFTISGNQLLINTSPNFEAKSSYEIRVRTTDQGGLSFEKALTINVLNFNERPTDLALSATSINENVAANTAVGTFTSTDPDAGNTFTYILVPGTGSTDNNAFTINGSQLQINSSPNFEAKSSYNIRVRTTDQGGLPFEKALTINVNDLNENPSDLALSATTINENVAATTAVGTLTSTDPDTGNTFAYSLVAGTGNTDNNAFTISGNQLQINSSPNFEAKSSYNIRVRTTDQGGLFFDKALTINVNDINETPTNLTLSTTSINEKVAANTAVGTFASTDPDTGNTFTYSLVAGTGNTDNNAFTINGNQLQINTSPNFATKSSYNIRVRTTDQGSLFFEKALTINVNKVINGTINADTLTGTSANESLFGLAGNDNLLGDGGNDNLSGDDGNDILTGASLTTFGVGEIDRLIGGAGNDTFVLGNSSRAYYNDGNNVTPGVDDYARIADFNSSQDTVRLFSAATYFLGASPLSGVSGTGLFIDNDGTAGLSAKDELIGIFENTILSYGQVTTGTNGLTFV